MRNSVKVLDPPYKLSIPPYKVADEEGDWYVVKLNSHVLGYTKDEEETERTLNMITKALKMTGAKMEN